MQKQNNFSLDLETEKFCLYHNKRHQNFTCEKLGPPGMCLEAYYAMYPWCFSFIYGGSKDKKSITVKCPASAHCTFNVVKIPPNKKTVVKNIVKSCLSVVRGYAQEVCNVEMRVVQAYKDCVAHEKYIFNLNGICSYICPAAFNSIFPQIFYALKRGDEKHRSRIIACPDHIVNLNFKFAGGLDGQQDTGCCDFDDYSIIIKKDGREQVVKLSDIYRKAGFKCFTAFQVLFPYWLTLKTGGDISFYTQQSMSAMVQCPNTKHKVEFKIFKDPFDGRIYYKVCAMRSSCPAGYSSNELNEVSESSDMPNYSLHIAYLYAMFLKESDAAVLSVSFHDPIEDVSYIIKRNPTV